MESKVYITFWLEPGKQLVVQSPSPNTDYRVVFEDDGETGYFYGLDLRLGGEPILDSLHIYNVSNATDYGAEFLDGYPPQYSILWTADGLKSALAVNAQICAIYDFENGRACCWSGFPPPFGQYKFTDSHGWDEALVDLFTS